MSTKAFEDGTNIAFCGISDLLKTCAVNVSAFAIYNGEVTDILDSTKAAIRFRKETNH